MQNVIRENIKSLFNAPEVDGDAQNGIAFDLGSAQNRPMLLRLKNVGEEAVTLTAKQSTYIAGSVCVETEVEMLNYAGTSATSVTLAPGGSLCVAILQLESPSIRLYSGDAVGVVTAELTHYTD